MESLNYLLIIGGSGDLGHALVESFYNTKSLWRICVIDTQEYEKADKNIIFNFKDKFSSESVNKLCIEIEKFSKYYDAIFDVTRGFKKGSIKSQDIFAQSEEMFSTNYYFSVLAAHLASKYMRKNGLLVFTGSAKVFKESCPDILAYQIAKTCTHSLAHILKDSPDMPEGICILTILPEMIDTQENRLEHPLEDFSKWINPIAIANNLKIWANKYERPKSGSFIVFKNQDDVLSIEFV